MQDCRLRFVEGKQKEFLNVIIQGCFGSQAAVSRFLGVSKTTVRHWVHGKNTLPKSAFERICNAFPEYKEFECFILEELPINWGAGKGQKASALKMKHIQNMMQDSIANCDTERLREFLELVKKHKVDNKTIPPLPKLSAEKSCVPLDTSGVVFSGKDLVKGIILPLELSIDLCYVVGAHIGDGSMNIYHSDRRTDYYYKCGGHQTNDKSWYDNVLVPLKKKLFNLQLSAKNYPDGTYAIQFRSKAVVCFYSKCLGLPLGNKCEKADIPKIILNAGLPYALSCISGIFDTDFTIAFKNKNNTVHAYPLIELKTKSACLVKTISKILNCVQIPHSTGDCSRFDKRFGKIIESHSLTISGRANIARWFDIVGSRNPNYLSKYLLWKRFGFCPPHLTYPQRKGILDGNKNPLEFYNAPDRI